MSLNHNDIEDINNITAMPNIINTNGKPCIVSTPEQVSVKREIHVSIGQGDGETKWKGCAWKLLLTKLVIKQCVYKFVFFVNDLLIWKMQTFSYFFSANRVQ